MKVKPKFSLEKYAFISITLPLIKGNTSFMLYINRFYITCVDKEDIDSTISELKILCLYSSYHFEKEEDILGGQLAKHHKINHTKLLRDLETLIVEIENGKFQIKNLPDYLSYWLFDHLREYDIPAFAAFPR